MDLCEGGENREHDDGCDYISLHGEDIRYLCFLPDQD